MASVRPFRRSDREQLTALVNAHVAAVIPGVTVSVNALLNQLEREPGEAIVDPWVIERRTLAAVERDAIVGGAHLLRYGDDERVSESYRNLAEIRAAALQFVRKISGYRKPSQANEAVFERAVDEIAGAAGRLLDELVTAAPPRHREHVHA